MEAERKRLRNGAGRGKRREGESFTRREEVQVEVEVACSSWWMKEPKYGCRQWDTGWTTGEAISYLVVNACDGYHLRPGGATSLTCCVCGVEAEGWIAVCSLLLPSSRQKNPCCAFVKNSQTIQKKLETSERCGNFRLTEFCDELAQLSEFFRRKQFSSSEHLPQV